MSFKNQLADKGQVIELFNEFAGTHGLTVELNGRYVDFKELKEPIIPDQMTNQEIYEFFNDLNDILPYLSKLKRSYELIQPNQYYRVSLKNQFIRNGDLTVFLAPDEITLKRKIDLFDKVNVNYNVDADMCATAIIKKTLPSDISDDDFADEITKILELTPNDWEEKR